MTTLQKALNAQIQKLPDVLLRQHLEKKLQEAGVEPVEALVESLAGHILSGGEAPFEWDGPDDRDVVLSFGEDDVDSLRDAADRIVEKMPEIVVGVTEAAARHMLAGLKKQWRDYQPYDEAVFDQFRFNLQERWAKGLDALRLLLELSRDMGTAYHNRMRRSKAKKGLSVRHVLSRLHIRSCQTMAEIITLMENGFADGAMSRWRTLYEISVVATLIADNGDDLAERYLEHEAVEAKRAMDEFIKFHAALGYAAPSKRSVRSVSAAFDAAIKKFGKDFGNPHGWAVGYLGIKNPNPKFVHLEDAAGRAAMRSYYKMASYNVHASPKGLAFRIGSVDEPGLLIAGSSNAGLEEPGQNAAFTFTQITALLIGDRPKLDDLVQLQIISMLRDEAAAAFLRAAKKLRRDEFAVRKEAEARRRKRQESRNAVRRAR